MPESEGKAFQAREQSGGCTREQKGSRCDWSSVPNSVIYNYAHLGHCNMFFKLGAKQGNLETKTYLRCKSTKRS